MSLSGNEHLGGTSCKNADKDDPNGLQWQTVRELRAKPAAEDARRDEPYRISDGLIPR